MSQLTTDTLLPEIESAWTSFVSVHPTGLLYYGLKFREFLCNVTGGRARYRVALEAIRTGVHILNDVSGLQKEPRFADLCAEFGTALIVMHAKGEPKSMQHNPVYEDVLAEVVAFLDQKVTLLRRLGVESIVVDPGIGFGKTLEHNVTLLRQLQVFNRWETPVLVGVSRKSMIGELLGGRDREGRLAGTIAAHYDAMVRGAKIIRVHDIQEAKDAILVYNALRA